MEEDSRRKYISWREVVLRQLSHADVRKKNNFRRFKAFLQDCRFELVRNVFLEMGANEVDFRSPWIIAWTDCCIPTDTYTRMKPYQKINHFPGMNEICIKDLLANNLKRMKKMLPHEYNFFPLTFCLPDEARLLLSYSRMRKKQDIFIIKPDRNCQGSGIEIVKGIRNTKKYRDVVCQKYITMPLLINGFKLDLRLYVLVTSITPLRIYIFNEGLVRLASVPYQRPNSCNLHEHRMHLTNYAVNRKSNEDYAGNWWSKNCKKSFAELEAFLDSMNVEHHHLWPTIDQIIVKTILSALPSLRHMFHAFFPMRSAMSPCFEILGFDVLLNDKIRPYLLEVNRSPSLVGSTAMDQHLKRCLIRNTIEMVLPSARQITLINDEQHNKSIQRLTNTSNIKQLTPKERIVSEYQEKREAKKMGNFRQIYPVEDDRYDAILQALFSPPSEMDRELYSATSNATDQTYF